MICAFSTTPPSTHHPDYEAAIDLSSASPGIEIATQSWRALTGGRRRPGWTMERSTCKTRAGITKEQLFSFYSEAKQQAYTKAKIKAGWRAAGISPFNLDAAIQPLLRKLEQKQSYGIHVLHPQASISTPSKFLARRHHRIAANYATSRAPPGPPSQTRPSSCPPQAQRT